MEYRFLGKTGMRVSALCMGCMTFEPGMVPEDLAHKMLDHYVELGGNFFDMANNYPGVEEVFGRWLKNRPDRDRFVIASKVRYPVGDGPNDVGLSRKHMMKQIDESLKKIGTDYLDLYQAHCWDHITPIEETLSTFDALVKSGKVRYIGCSNFTGWHIAKSQAVSEKHNWVAFVSVQAQYSLMTRSAEFEIIPASIEHRVSVNCWSPLAAGWLSGKYHRDKMPPEGSRMARVAKTKEEWEQILSVGVDTQIPHPTKLKSEEEFRELMQKNENERRWRIIDAVGDVAKVHGKTHSQVAFAWLLAKPGVCSPVMGVSSLEQMDENLGSLGLRISTEEMNWLNKVSDQGKSYPHDFLEKYGYTAPWR